MPLSNLPPGCTNADIERAFGGPDDPSHEAEQACTLLDAVIEQLRSRPWRAGIRGQTTTHDGAIEDELQAASDKISDLIDQIVLDRNEARQRASEWQAMARVYEQHALPVLRQAAVGTSVGASALALTQAARSALDAIVSADMMI